MGPKSIFPIAAVLILGVAGSHDAAAADPPSQAQTARVAGGEVIEFGSFHCTAQKEDGDKLAWSCPAQSFASKFKEAPTLFFSIAGFDRLAATDTGFSLDIDTKGDATKDGFNPIVDDASNKPAAEKSTIGVTWIAIGEGERAPRKPRASREERLKLREMRQQEKLKNQ